MLNWGYTSLTNYYGTWYYVEGGILNWKYTGLAKYYDTWYYIQNGVLNWNYTGITSYGNMTILCREWSCRFQIFSVNHTLVGDFYSLPNNTFFGPMAGSKNGHLPCKTSMQNTIVSLLEIRLAMYCI